MSYAFGKKDIAILEEIKNFFGVGSINIRKTRNNAVFHVQCFAVKDLNNVVIPHFNKYPLITKKKADFILFSSIIELILLKKHLDIKSLNQIIDIRSSMNKGLSDDLKLTFPNYKPVVRPTVINEGIFDPY